MAQDFDRVFASTGTADTFSDADYNEGLEAIVGAVPPSKRQHNGIWKEVDLKLLEIHQEGITPYSAATDYPVFGRTKGQDGFIYVAATANGPASSVVDPVGDNTDTWFKVGTSRVTTLTESNPAFLVSQVAVRLKITATAGGGGGGGVAGSGAGTSALGSAGGGGSTAIRYTNNISATYAVIVGAGGNGGPDGNNGGSSGGTTSVTSSNVAISCTGGFGGAGDVGTSGSSVTAGSVGGGTATGGTINLRGGDSEPATIVTGDIANISSGGDSYWGQGRRGTQNSSGSNGVNFGAGASAASVTNGVEQRGGGLGAAGIVVFEEFF